MSNPADNAIDAIHLHSVFGVQSPTPRDLQEGRHLLALAAEDDEVPPLWPNLVEAIDLTSIDNYALEAADDGDAEQLAHALVDLDTIRLRIALAIQVIEDALVPLMTTKTLEVNGLPVLEQRGGKDRKAWQSDELLRAVVRKALTARAPKANVDTANAVHAVVDEVAKAVPFTGSLGWRVTALRSMGIDPDEFCEVSPSRHTVQIHRSAAEAVTS